MQPKKLTAGPHLPDVERMPAIASEPRPIVSLPRPSITTPTLARFDMHYELELGIVLRGSVRRHYADGFVQSCRPGDVWFHGIWEPHGWEVCDVPYERVLLEIWPPMIASLYFAEAPGIPWMAPFHAAPRARPAVSKALEPEVRRVALAICALDGRDDASARLQLRWLVLELMLMLNSPAPGRQSRETRPTQPYGSIAPAVELALASHQSLTTAEAASACRMSPTNFARLFPQLMGLSFAQFALRHRLNRAADDIRSTTEPLKAIVRKWGFVDESHLHRLFQKHYRCAPSEYREAQLR